MRKRAFDAAFFLILACFILIRLPSLSQPLAEDGHGWVNAALAPTWNEKFLIIPHPPLSMLFFAIVGFTGSSTALHFVPLLFQVLAVIATYLIATYLFDRKTARYAIIIMALSIWLITPGMQLDTDGSMLLFYMAAGTYAYLRMTHWNEQTSLKRSWKQMRKDGTLAWGALLALMLSAMMLTKFTAFLFPLTLLFADWLIRARYNLQSYLRARIVPYMGSALLFIAGMAYTLLAINGYKEVLFGHSKFLFGNFLHQNIVNVFSIFSQLIILMSPILIVFLIYSCFLYPKMKPTNKQFLKVLYFFIAIFTFFHMFIITASFRPLERYLLPTAFCFALFGALSLRNISWNRRNILLFIGAALASLILFIVQNLQENALFPIYPKELYISRVLHLQWNFLFPFRGSSGPYGFYISFLTIGTAFALIGLLCVLAALWRKQRVLLLLLMLGIGLSYNLVMAEEYLFSGMHPNVGKVANEVIAYADTHDLPQPVYIWNWLGYSRLKDRDATIPFTFAYQDNPTLIANMSATHGSILFIDYGKLGEDTQLWKTMHECRTVQSFSDKNVTLGYVFDCSRRG